VLLSLMGDYFPGDYFDGLGEEAQRDDGYIMNGREYDLFVLHQRFCQPRVASLSVSRLRASIDRT